MFKLRSSATSLLLLLLSLQLLQPAKYTIWFNSSEDAQLLLLQLMAVGSPFPSADLRPVLLVNLLGVPLEQVLCLQDPAAEVAGVLRVQVDGVNVPKQVSLVRRLQRAVGAPEDALVVAAVVVDRVAVHANLCNRGREREKELDCHTFHNDGGGGGGDGGSGGEAGEEEEAENEGGGGGGGGDESSNKKIFVCAQSAQQAGRQVGRQCGTD